MNNYVFNLIQYLGIIFLIVPLIIYIYEEPFKKDLYKYLILSIPTGLGLFLYLLSSILYHNKINKNI
jgi:predicted membrane channel-forming protein YqfA (hemolysin III family)